MPRENSNPPPAKRRRTKDGCRPCRIRKKKCDGRKPNCISCERNVLLCSWFPNSIRNDGDDCRTESEQLSLTNQDKKRKCSSSSSSSSYSTSTSDDHDSMSSSPFSFSPISNKEGGKGEQVEGNKQRQQQYLVPVFQSSTRARDISSLLKQPALEPIFRSSTSILLYQHWLERTGEAMSAQRGKSNAFVTELPRLAIAYPDTVLQGLLACSGIHYCNGNKALEMEESTWTHLGLALRSLKHGLTKLVAEPGVDPVPLLATALVLCFVETTRGDVHGALSHHLRAAHILFNAVLTSRSAPLMDQSLLEFLKEFYIYIARITEISCDSELLPHRDEYRPAHDPMSAAPWISNKSFGILVGCAHELFDMIPQVSALGRRKRRRSNDAKKQKRNSQHTHTHTHATTPSNESVIIEDDDGYENSVDEMSYYSLQAKILAWHPPPGAHRDFITCGAIYQQALLCYLDISCATPLVAAQAQLPESIQDRFNSLNSLLTELPHDAPVSSTLCWPLALFGSIAREESQRAIILGRLEAMWKFLQIGNIMATMNLLKRLWGYSDDGDCTQQQKDKDSSAVDEGVKLSKLGGDDDALALTPRRGRGRRGRRHCTSKGVTDPGDMEGLMKAHSLMISFA